VESVIRKPTRIRNDANGKNADYIPYLAQVDPKMFGIAVVPPTNQVLKLGEVNYSFSIQSISKVFYHGLAMEELGPARSSKKLVRSLPGAPHSPWQWWICPVTRGIRSSCGRIATTSIISGKDAGEKWNKILASMAESPGKIIADRRCYKSEAATNTENKALSMLLAKYDGFMPIIQSWNLHQAVFSRRKRCPACRMGATWPNNGITPHRRTGH